MNLPFAESWKAKSVETIYRSTHDEREKWLESAKFNLFNLKSQQVYIDLLTDSGTSAMSQEQWAEIMTGDESYAGSKSFYQLKDVIGELFGFPHFLPTHQGRAAENVLFSAMIKEGDIIPGNAHFDTTRGHIEFRKATAVDCTIDEAKNTSLLHPFKGNIDLNKLKKILADNPGRIPLIIITITCNTTGGQPVSMRNLKDVHDLAQEYGVPVFLDSARFAENAWFIKQREEEFNHMTIPQITRQMFSYADGMTMSGKKDGLVNIGGFIGFRDKELWKKASTFNIMYEGFLTYGGMAGRDMAAYARGLREVTGESYLESRIKQVEFLGNLLTNFHIPIQMPPGGHAIFIDAMKFLPAVPREEFIAQTLVIELYLESGVRSSEIGSLMTDRDPASRKNRVPELEMIRLAIPRRVYSNNHMEYVAMALKNVYDRRNEITHGFRIISEVPIMRHFTVELERTGK